MREHDPETAGLYRRGPDAYTDEMLKNDANKWQEQFGWLGEDLPGRSNGLQAVQDYLEAQLRTNIQSYISATLNHTAMAVSTSNPVARLTQMGYNVLTDLYYGARDAFAFRRVKTAATVYGGIGVGAAIGFVVGTLAFPVIGSALGAAFGASTAAILQPFVSLGALTILGAFSGSRAGKWIAKKLYKKEARYQLPIKFSGPIKDKFKIPTECSTLISAYLYNRSKQVQSKSLKKLYKSVHRGFIRKQDPVALDKISWFFCDELTKLAKLCHEDPGNVTLKRELEAVRHILETLKQGNLIRSTKTVINDRLLAYYNSEQQRQVSQRVDVPQNGETARPALMQELSAQLAAGNKRPTQKPLDSRPEHLRLSGHGLSSGSMGAQAQDQEKKLKDFIDALPTPKKDHGKTIQISAQGNDALAIQMVSETIKRGCVPILNANEFSERSRKQHIYKQGYLAAQGKEREQKKPFFARSAKV